MVCDVRLYRFVSCATLLSTCLLMRSCPCVLQKANENMSPMTIAKLMKELSNLVQSPPDDIKVYFSENNITNIEADIKGPG